MKSFMTDGMRAAEVTMTIKVSERKWRKRLPFLYYQYANGLGLLVACYSTFIWASRLHLNGGMHWVTLVAINAFSLSIVRELEHDLIHERFSPSTSLFKMP